MNAKIAHKLTYAPEEQKSEKIYNKIKLKMLNALEHYYLLLLFIVHSRVFLASF